MNRRDSEWGMERGGGGGGAGGGDWSQRAAFRMNGGGGGGGGRTPRAYAGSGAGSRPSVNTSAIWSHFKVHTLKE